MKKIILGFVAAVALLNLISCSEDNDIERNYDNETSSKVLNLASANNEDYVYSFVKKHVEINDVIISILEKETDLNSEILNEFSSGNITSEKELKSVLQKSGIKKYNELSELFLLQVENSKIFKSNNPAFFKLDKSEQDILVTKYVDEVLNYDYNQVTSNCADKLKRDKARCQRNLNLNGSLALIGCLGGPLTCALGTFGAAATHTFCVQDAEEDYYYCLKG